MPNVGDDILHNILARLPGKPLLRFRCVSKHWNELISSPYFMKSRSRQMMLLPFTGPLVAIDVNEAQHVVRLLPSLLDDEDDCTKVSIVGTLNGIVLLVLTNRKSSRCKLILYNPLTCAFKIAMVVGPPLPSRPDVFGFGYGVTKDDLKIVRFQICRDSPDYLMYAYNFFDFKTSSWSTQSQYLTTKFYVHGDAGTFLNGVLHWVTSPSNLMLICRVTLNFEILTLNVKEMVFSNIKLPDGLKYVEGGHLGSIGGCLCLINNVDRLRFDVWLMKECSWMKAHSFTLPFQIKHFSYPVCILGNGKLIFKDTSFKYVICDIFKDSYTTLDDLPILGDVKGINMQSYFNMVNKIYHINDMRSIEYVESLVSPSDMCLPSICKFSD
ncbi:F-box protein CPR1-like [Bidens hawaiensis]|uniref:F-box protein CPR1-like n=1 Tax=Bidens hawaiensis TaxID=980011 RepID=UPI00404A4A3D